MQAYLIRRLIGGVITIFIVSTLAFMLIRLIPGDIIMSKLAETGTLSPERMEQARRELGLDKPILQSYVEWLGGAVRGDFGNSLFFEEKKTTKIIIDSLPVTIELAIMSFLISMLIAIPVGVVSAVRQDTVLDYGARLLAIAGLAVPTWWLAVMVILYLSIGPLQYAPPFGYVPFWEAPLTNLEQFYLPAIIGGVTVAAGSMRLTRSTVLEVLRLDYVRTARAKGLRERVVIGRHVLANSLLPVVTLMGLQFAGLLSGAVILETVFSLPGLGRTTLNAILVRDYTQVQTNVLFIGLLVVGMNLLVDISYGFLDPRVRYR